VVINGVIGAPKLLSIGHSHKVASRLGPRVSRVFVSLGALALCALVLAFAGEEAQAQQLPQAQHTAIDGQAAGKITQLPVEATPTEETSPHETRLARTSPVEPTSQPALIRPVSGSPTEEPSPAAPGPALAELGLPIGATLPDPEPVSGPALQSDPVSGSMTVPAEQDGAETPVDPDLAAPAPGSTTSEPMTKLVPVTPVDQETAPGTVDPELVAIEESNPLPLLPGEAPAAEPAVLYSGEEEDSYSLYILGTSMVDAVESLEETLESATANALGVLVDEASSWPAAEEGEGLVDTTLAGLFYEEEAKRAPASEPGGETKPSPTGTGPEWPLQDNGPQPVSPFTPPPAGSSFSLSGGHVGAGIVALLLCVLASSLILLRREFKLLWTFCELPKPSSVLLLPPERPG
jgi:hypothetical protein